MSIKNTQFNWPIRVYYEDTDAGGIVYYANYLKFFERARTEWLRALDINQSIFLEQNLGFVVRKVEMENISSARLDDLLQVTTSISKLKRASLVFEQQITAQSEQLIATATVLVACIDTKLMKPSAIPSPILGALNSVC